MLLHQQHDSIRVSDRNRKTVKQKLDQYIREHEGKKPMCLRVGEDLIEVVRGFGIPVYFAAGLQSGEIVIIT